MSIQAIQTRYAGCHFRSRLEARWAVFFDALGYEWQYEPEGFETPAGWYLPDFWLPSAQAWIEVKGAKLTRRDLERCAYVAADAWLKGRKFRILIGDIPRNPLLFALGFPGPLVGVPCLSWSSIDPKVLEEPIAPVAKPELIFQIEAGEIVGPTGFVEMVWCPNVGDPDLLERLPAALTAARSARFEHGRSGAQ